MMIIYYDMIRKTIVTELNVGIGNKVNPQPANGNKILSQMSGELK